MTHGTDAHAQTGHRGFTLLELSITLFIIAVVTGMSVATGISVLATARQSATQQKMKTIDDALMAYRAANDRLPCPGDLTIAPGAANYGIEGANPGTCTGGTPAANHTAAGATNTFATGAEGSLPALTLGLPQDFMTDGWGNKFRYAVDVSMTVAGAFPSVNIGCTNGAITVKDALGTARSTGATYALISHGPNGHGGYTPSGGIVNAGSTSVDEQTNCHCNSSGVYNSAYAPTYVQKDPAYDSGQTGNALYYFDDLVSYRERWQMQTAWDKTGTCPYIYVADGNNNRIQVFNTGGAFVRGIGAGYNGVSGSIGSTGTGNGQFNGPFGVALDASGNLWVADDGNHRVEEFNSSGTYLSQFGSGYGCCGGPFDYPTGIAFDASGNIWVVNNNPSTSSGPVYAVLKFNTNGTLLTSFGGSSTVGASTFLSFDATGNLWISQPNGPYLDEFNTSGTLLRQITAYATSAGDANAIDMSGNVWTLGGPGGVNKVQEFNSSGTVLSSFGSTGSGNGQFNFTYEPDNGGIAIDASGNLWVVDSGNNRVQEFNSSGSFIGGIGAGYNGVGGSIGSTGTGSGQFNQPEGIAISSR